MGRYAYVFQYTAIYVCMDHDIDTYKYTGASQ